MSAREKAEKQVAYQLGYRIKDLDNPVNPSLATCKIVACEHYLDRGSVFHVKSRSAATAMLRAYELSVSLQMKLNEKGATE